MVFCASSATLLALIVTLASARVLQGELLAIAQDAAAFADPFLTHEAL